MKQYNVILNKFPANPRNKRRSANLGISGSESSSGGSVIGGGSAVVEADFDIMEGEGISIDKQSVGNLIYTISHGNTSEGESTANEGTFVVRNVLVDKFGHVIGVESGDMSLIFDGKYLRKDKPDSTDYLLGLNGGATFGDYAGGPLGSGGKFDKDGNIEGNSLTLREFLEVPELRFNRIDVVSGELWNSIAFGLIESVDTENQIVTLKLEEGELSGLHINDFCRGIFHNLTGNETSSGTDSAGFDTVAGFSTSYFTPIEIIDNAHFKYELKPGTSTHPAASMKFAVYGNATDKNRQASAYSTGKYKRYLINVDTWEINPSKNITYQDGDLSNLVINGESLAGGSVFLNNVYFGGNVWNVPGLGNGLKGMDAYSVTLSTYSAVYNTKDGLSDEVDVVTGSNHVVTGGTQVVIRDFRITTRIQATKGTEPLRYSTVLGAGKYLVTATGIGCTFTVTDGLVVVHNVTADKAEVRLEVNCEGMATYEQVFTIVRVTDGVDGTDVEWIFKRSATETGKPSKPATSENVDDYVPDGWTDDPVGPDPNNPFEWSCKREKKDGVWGAFSAVFLWSKWGKDGTDIEYIYGRTRTSNTPEIPPSPQTGGYIPDGGWTANPTGPDATYLYEWMCKREKKNNVWQGWSTPSLWAKYSLDGEDGKTTYQVYRRASSQPSTPTSESIPPSGWALDPPTGSSNLLLWMSKIILNGNGTVYSSWSTPIRITGDTGAQGPNGPFMTFRRKYSSSKQYTGTDDHVEAVYTEDANGNKTFWITKTTAGTFSNEYPRTSSDYWETFQGEFESIATGLALIEEANIAGWWFSDLRIESQNRNCIIDGNADDHPRIALGASYANRDTAPTRLYDDGSVFFGKGTFGGTIVSAFSGNRIMIDPESQSLTMINTSGKEVLSLSFENVSGQQSAPAMKMYLYSTNGSLIRTISLHSGGLYLVGADGTATSLNAGTATLGAMPTIDPKVKGMLWRDGNNVKVSLG